MSIIGILGGGHLARMTTQAAQRLGALVAVLDKDENSPAAQVTALAVDGDWNDFELVSEFAQSCDVVSPESEDVPVEVLERLDLLEVIRLDIVRLDAAAATIPAGR